VIVRAFKPLSFAKTVSGSLDGHSGLSDCFKTLGTSARLGWWSGLFRLSTLPGDTRRSGITESGRERLERVA
jgi:hypothetical protein